MILLQIVVDIHRKTTGSVQSIAMWTRHYLSRERIWCLLWMRNRPPRGPVHGMPARVSGGLGLFAHSCVHPLAVPWPVSRHLRCGRRLRDRQSYTTMFVPAWNKRKCIRDMRSYQIRYKYKLSLYRNPKKRCCHEYNIEKNQNDLSTLMIDIRRFFISS